MWKFPLYTKGRNAHTAAHLTCQMAWVTCSPPGVTSRRCIASRASSRLLDTCGQSRSKWSWINMYIANPCGYDADSFDLNTVSVSRKINAYQCSWEIVTFPVIYHTRISCVVDFLRLGLLIFNTYRDRISKNIFLKTWMISDAVHSPSCVFHFACNVQRLNSVIVQGFLCL